MWKFGNTSGDYSFHPEIAVAGTVDDAFDLGPAPAAALMSIGEDYDHKVFNEWRISYRLIKPENKKLEDMRPRLRSLFDTFGPLLGDGAQRHKVRATKIGNFQKKTEESCSREEPQKGVSHRFCKFYVF